MTALDLPLPAAPAPLLPRHLSEAEFTVLVNAGETRAIAADQTLFRRGELGHAMFVIRSGQVRLEFGDGLPDKLIGEREYFGELALLIGNHSRVASAVAQEASEVAVIDQRAFDSLLEESPALLAQFMRRSFAYLVASEQQLIAGLKRRNEDLLVTLDSLRQAQSELGIAERLVRTDVLTGLYNRRGLYDWTQALTGEDGEASLLLVDLDRFKYINDRYGHLCGDAALKAVAAELTAVAGPEDLPCRLGGDELALLSRGASDEQIRSKVLQLLDGVRRLRLRSPGGEQVRISVSIGAAARRPGSDWPGWYSDADTALYAVKGRGGDDWQLADRGG